MLFFALLSGGKTVIIDKEVAVGVVISLLFFIALIFFLERDYRKRVAKIRSQVNLPKFDNYNGKNPPPAQEAVHEYVLITVDQAAQEFRPKCKFSPDDVYYKLGKRYSRALIKKALFILVDDGKLEEVPTRKGTCFIRS